MDPASVQGRFERDDNETGCVRISGLSLSRAFVDAPGLDGFPRVFIALLFWRPPKGLRNSRVWKTPVLTGSPSALQDQLATLVR